MFSLAKWYSQEFSNCQFLAASFWLISWQILWALITISTATCYPSHLRHPPKTTPPKPRDIIQHPSWFRSLNMKGRCLQTSPGMPAMQMTPKPRNLGAIGQVCIQPDWSFTHLAQPRRSSTGSAFMNPFMHYLSLPQWPCGQSRCHLIIAVPHHCPDLNPGWGIWDRCLWLGVRQCFLPDTPRSSTTNNWLFMT